MTVTIRLRNTNSPITVTIPTGTTRFFQVENFESLTVSTSSSQPGFFSLFIKKPSVFAVIIRTTIAMNVAINTTMIMIVKLTAKRILFIKGSFSFTPLISKH